MNRLVAVGLMALGLALAPAAVVAQERLGDAGLGALSGAVVLGPIGAVGGAIIGYTAGPSIAHAWGLKRSPGPPARRSTRATPPRASSKPAAVAQGSAASAAAREGVPARPAVQSVGLPSAMPPVQSLD